MLINNAASSSSISAFPWKQFWSFKHIQPKIQIFIWKVIHNGIAVKRNIHRFVSGINTNCSFCHQDEESIAHLLIDCPWSRIVFEKAGLSVIALPKVTNLFSLFAEWMEGDLNNDFVKRLCIMWNIWKLRNDIIFSNSNISEDLVLKRSSQDFDLCMADGVSDNNVNFSTTCNPSWYPAHYPYVKINVDAAFVPNNAAAGAIAHDHNGRFVGCETKTFEATSSLLAEAVGCRLGMELGKKFGFKKIIIEGDATNITSAILGEVANIPWSIRYVILEIRDSVALFDDVKFLSVPKVQIVWLIYCVNMLCMIL
ncbi:uncharacterized protein LOC113347985 [Papaver somniferum]|uniref:uncharacterized protein LOC113347985 n=1 Tax=Papaver somniferum TaxID=3469 RepID=UPI000E6FA8E9|nr:uncharacterized protein LOC113347985 [Papaver somniferum]